MNKQKLNPEIVLEALPFLEGYEKGGVEDLLKVATRAVIPKGKIISSEGDKCTGFSFVLNGSIKVYKIAENGREITLYYLNKGESCILTASCILSKRNFPAISESETETEVLTIPSEELLDWVDRYPHWRSYVFNLLTERLTDIITIVEEIIFRNVDVRLANFLLKSSENGKKLIEKTHYAIASDIGTSREVVSRLLKEFEYSGIISLSRSQISVLSTKKLIEKINL